MSVASESTQARVGSRRSGLVRGLKQFCYSKLNSPRRVYRKTLESFASEAERIMDIGCGYAAPDLESLQADTATKVGLDLVDEFRPQKGSTVQFVRGDCHALPFGDGHFDLIMCRSVLEHVERPVVAFREISRVLRPGGHFVFLTPNRWDYVSLAGSLIPNRYHAGVVKAMTGRNEEDTFATYYRANSRRQIRKLAAQAGLDVVRLSMLREHPHYLQRNAPLYVLGVIYEQTVERLLTPTRPWILGICRRSPGSPPA